MTDFRCKFCHKLLLKFRTTTDYCWHCGRGQGDKKQMVIGAVDELAKYTGEYADKLFLNSIEIKCPKCKKVNKIDDWPISIQNHNHKVRDLSFTGISDEEKFKLYEKLK